ncbi:MAG: MBL fold metallo-hydrolase [Gemmatimonadaceae bacterium]|nr:MBL fold metallo-hydrolase [Gemmatimonadaceae bacterium]MCW5825045.1 MBL fold metallo-hydrolase [Gemmatimonadaceae bacterium]
MKAWSLGSGSRGNGLVLAAGDRAILVDCGFGPRAIATRLKRLGLVPEMIEALVITHEHQDHADGAAKAQHKWRWPVYASAGTHRALREIPGKYRVTLSPGAAVAAGAFTVESCAIPHDAAEPLAVAVTAANGARVGIAHDLGAVPAPLEALFARCDALCLEANHDVAMLRDGPYPPALQARIRGGRGHISNAEAAALALRLAHRGLQALALLHLSETNNTPALAERTVNEALRRGRLALEARAAAGRTPAPLFALRGAAPQGQLTLAL